MPTKINARLPFLSRNIVLIITGVVFGALGAFSIGPYLDMVEQLGFRIPQDDMAMDYAVSLVWAAFLGACIVFSPIRHKDKNMLLWAWFIKCFIALFALLFYEAHYPSDAQGFYSWGLTTPKASESSFVNLLLQKQHDSTSLTYIIIVSDNIAHARGVVLSLENQVHKTYLVDIRGVPTPESLGI